MESGPRLTRRRALGLAVGAAVARASGGAEGARARERPGTLEGCVASMETLISPEAIDRIAELSEALRFEYRGGFNRLRNERWGEGWSGDVRGGLRDECAAAGIGDEELTDYLISTIAWRRRGRALDVATQLAPFREASRREEERRRKIEETSKRTGVRVIACQVEILDRLYFARGATKRSPGQEKLTGDFAQMFIGNPQMAHVEVQAHAAPGEQRPADLSRERAFAVVEALVRLGVPAGRLTAHGLGTRFRNRSPEGKPKDLGGDADARAEFFILRRSSG